MFACGKGRHTNMYRTLVFKHFDSITVQQNHIKLTVHREPYSGSLSQVCGTVARLAYFSFVAPSSGENRTIVRGIFGLKLQHTTIPLARASEEEQKLYFSFAAPSREEGWLFGLACLQVCLFAYLGIFVKPVGSDKVGREVDLHSFLLSL